MIEPPVNPATALAALQGREVFQAVEPARLAVRLLDDRARGRRRRDALAPGRSRQRALHRRLRRLRASVGGAVTGLPSQWNLFWNRALPFKKRLPAPGIFDILMRTMMPGSAGRALRVERDADLYLRPPIDQYGMLEFDKIVEAGYRHALAELPKWTGARG